MFKIIDIDAFLEMTKEYVKSDTEVIVSSIITPIQSVHAKLIDDTMRYKDGIWHEDVFVFIIGKIYDVGQDIDLSTKEDRVRKLEIVNNTIKEGPSNFINIRWIISSRLFYANVRIPSFITKREYDYLEELNAKLKKLGIDTFAEVTNYNPIALEYDYSNLEDIYFDDSETAKINLDIALEFLQENRRVVDYDLPFGGETIIEASLQEEKKIS